MKRNWAAFALDLIARGEPAAMVTLAGVHGSAPRDAGTRMIVGRGQVFGTVGGGNLEYLLIDQARRLLNQDQTDVSQQDYPLGPLLAQCCGGRVRVLLERLKEDSQSWLSEATAAGEAGKRYTLRASIADAKITRSFAHGWPAGAVEGAILSDGSGAIAAKAAWSHIVEHVAPIDACLYVFGAGHVGTALIHIAQTLPFRLRWFDSRAELSGQNPALTFREDLVVAANEAPSGAFFVVLTHAHEIDYQLTRAILSRGDARYCGLIGSDTKRARFLSRLAKDGIDASGLTCPIGEGRIRSKDPAAIAVSTCAELLLRLEAASKTASDAQRAAS